MKKHNAQKNRTVPFFGASPLCPLDLTPRDEDSEAKLPLKIVRKGDCAQKGALRHYVPMNTEDWPRTAAPRRPRCRTALTARWTRCNIFLKNKSGRLFFVHREGNRETEKSFFSGGLAPSCFHFPQRSGAFIIAGAAMLLGDFRAIERERSNG
jgi:hypothetical protein